MKLLDAIDRIRVYDDSKGQRAPHKPLLLLYALDRQSRDPNAKFEFSLIENDIKKLLNEFWKPPKSGIQTVKDPFWRLQNDGIWKVRHRGKTEPASSTPPGVRDLRNSGATGYFSEEVVQEIADNPDIVRQAAQKLLDKHFPESLHRSIMERVGMSYEADFSRKEPSTKAKRDPKFRENVLHAYGYSCAVCGFNLQVKTLPVGLEAAHIKWHQHGGPDTEDNGLALCATHHKLLDSGVLTLSEDYKILLSKWVHVPNEANNFIEEHQKREIRLPINKEHSPSIDYIRWHREVVFKEPEIAF